MQPEGVPVTTQALRTKTGLSKEDFDAAALELRKSQTVFLTRNSVANSMSPEDLEKNVFDPSDRSYHVSIALREPVGKSSASQWPGRTVPAGGSEVSEDVALSQQKATELHGRNMTNKNNAVLEQLWGNKNLKTVEDADRYLTKDKLDSLLKKTKNPVTGELYPATELQADLRPTAYGRSFETIKAQLLKGFADMMKKAGDTGIPPIRYRP